MKVFILGMGHVGKALASQLKAQGHSIVGTTTTETKVEELQGIADEVVVVKGSETERIIAAAKGCDAMIVTVAPNVKNTRTVEERQVHYNDVLVKSCNSAQLACPWVIFLSSFSVYGDGGEGSRAISEVTPTGNHQEPSSKYYQLAEQEILSNEQGCALRFPDMYGAPDDLSFAERVRMSHSYFSGKTIFGADAPLYAIHFEDVVAAVLHTLDNKLSGIFNVCDNDNVPATNQQVFDAICAEEGLSPLEFLNQIKAPSRKISAQKIYDSGYRVKHDDPNSAVLERAAKA